MLKLKRNINYFIISKERNKVNFLKIIKKC